MKAKEVAGSALKAITEEEGSHNLTFSFDHQLLTASPVIRVLHFNFMHILYSALLFIEW